jgi:hypothetical protein
LEKQSRSGSVIPVQYIVLMGVSWAVLALLFFLIFSVQVPGQSRPDWYKNMTTVFEVVAFLWAAILCFRNWRSSQIVSGRSVWLFIGLGMLCYFIGGVLFSYWETVLGIEPDVSPADFFYVLTYVFLILGMGLAVSSRRLNLEIWQWGIVGAIAALGILIAWWISAGASTAQVPGFTTAWVGQPAVARTMESPVMEHPIALQPADSLMAQASPKVTISPESGVAPTNGLTKATSADSIKTANVPEWAKLLQETLAPLKSFLDWFYVVSDILLLIIATTMLLAFWGGRFSQSWRMIAAAAFCLYIADIWFKYATTRPGTTYESGGVLEVFWIFSGILFGIGAALEYDISSRARHRGTGRRRPVA